MTLSKWKDEMENHLRSAILADVESSMGILTNDEKLAEIKSSLDDLAGIYSDEN